MRQYFIEIPYPPSNNHYYMNVRGGRRIIHPKNGVPYVDFIIKYLSSTFSTTDGWDPLSGRLKVEIVLHMPDRRRRDIDNAGGKAVTDSFTKSGFWLDDSQIDDLRIRRAELIKNGRAYILIEELS